MSQIVERHKQALDKAVQLAVGQTTSRLNTQWRNELTRIIPPDDEETFYPQGRIEKPYVMMAVPNRGQAVPFDYSTPPTQMPYFGEGPQFVRLNAKQMAHILPNGSKIVWWTWEVGR